MIHSASVNAYDQKAIEQHKVIEVLKGKRPSLIYPELNTNSKILVYGIANGHRVNNADCNGIINNKYTMQVTGIKPNSTYVFSCWVAWDSKYNGGGQIVSFSDVSSMGATEGFTPHSTTNLGGSYIDDEEDLKTGRILKKKNSGNLIWYKAYSFVQTNGNADLGSIDIHLGLNGDDNFPPSTDPLSNRFFTDLRFEQVESLEGCGV